MPLEAESPNAKQLRAEESASTRGANQTDRPLGRGLQDISHLFLPRSAASGDDRPTGDQTSRRISSVSPTRTGVAVLRPSASLPKDQLIATLKECHSALEGDMRAIEAGISGCPCGDIDMLALDGAQRLTIIDVAADTPSDGILLRGVNHVDWIVRNLSLMRRLYPAWPIDASQVPRLFVVAPHFSPVLRNAVRQIARPEITCFKYHTVALSGGAGIFIERLGRETE